MNIQSITLVVTEDCNFDCDYCYKQKNYDRMKFATAKKAMAFFLPFLSDHYNLNFYGGEPLLCFDLIEETVSFLEQKNKEYGKKPQYSLTTNGSLITDEIIKALETHKFSVVYSFDGTAQEIHRKDGSFDLAVSNINKILERPNIGLEVNSVFTPESVGHISDSLALIMNLGVKNINLSLSLFRPWNTLSVERLGEELAKLRGILVSQYLKSKDIPVMNFRKDGTEGFFYCAGGQDRMAVTSEENVWGCDLFADYFRGKEKRPEYQDYFFGNLDTFVKNYKKVYPKISSNYAELSMDNFATSQRACLFCSNLEDCIVCPVAAAFSGVPIGEIPPFVCDIQKIKIAERQKFLGEIIKY